MVQPNHGPKNDVQVQGNQDGAGGGEVVRAGAQDQVVEDDNNHVHTLSKTWYCSGWSGPEKIKFIYT